MLRNCAAAVFLIFGLSNITVAQVNTGTQCDTDPAFSFQCCQSIDETVSIQNSDLNLILPPLKYRTGSRIFRQA